MNSKIRAQLEKLQKPAKRQRIEEESTDESIEVLVVDEEMERPENQQQPQQQEQPEISDGEDSENAEPLMFTAGVTNKGGLCIWYQGYRYRHKSQSWWRCSVAKCPATAKAVEQEDVAPGRAKWTIFRKWKALGLFALYGGENEESESARMTFRRILALALIPMEHVRRAFCLIAAESPTAQLAPFLRYFAVVYIGQTQPDVDNGDDAFLPEPRRDSSIMTDQRRSTNSAASSTANLLVDYSISDHDYTNPPLQRWQQHIVRPPQYEIAFWNVNERASRAIAKTNNAMEASHKQFADDLNTRPAMSDFLDALCKDVDKQV